MSVGRLPVLTNNVKSMKLWIFQGIHSDWAKENQGKFTRCQGKSDNN